MNCLTRRWRNARCRPAPCHQPDRPPPLLAPLPVHALAPSAQKFRFGCSDHIAEPLQGRHRNSQNRKADRSLCCSGHLSPAGTPSRWQPQPVCALCSVPGHCLTALLRGSLSAPAAAGWHVQEQVEKAEADKESDREIEERCGGRARRRARHARPTPREGKHIKPTARCLSLASVTIPDSVTRLGRSAPW